MIYVKKKIKMKENYIILFFLLKTLTFNIIYFLTYRPITHLVYKGEYVKEQKDVLFNGNSRVTKY